VDEIRTVDEMEINFNEMYLRDLYLAGKADKKHRFQPQVVKKYIRVIDLMRDEDNVRNRGWQDCCHNLQYYRIIESL
jgi:hypothetical protein